MDKPLGRFSLLIILIVIALAGSITFLQTPLSVTTPPDPLAARIAKMSLDEKIGQLMFIGFVNPHLDDHIREMITRYHIGGINLLGRNVKSEAQAKELIRDLHALNASSTDIPLFMAADQEGGTVVRFRFMKELTPQPDIKTPAQAEIIAATRGKELRAMGINVNFAPLADYLTDPNGYLRDRVFHGTPEDVAARADAMMRGYTRSGILPVLKHFPGHGNETPDPHTAAATLAVEGTALEENLLPFRKLVARKEVGMIMTAHIIIPSVDSRPATHSSKFLTDLLRNEWQFDGVILTDDLEMASAGSDVGASARDALRAGADMLMVTPTPSKQRAAMATLKSAVQSGEITEARIDESLTRILQLKKQLQ